MIFDPEIQIDKGTVINTVLIAACSLLLLLLLSFKSVVPRIEKDLLKHVSKQLIENKIENILISAEGRDIYLEGWVSQETNDIALRVTREVRGVRRVHNKIKISEPTK